MKFTTATVSLALAAATQAATVAPRDLETVMRVMTNVLDNMGKLDATIAAYSGADQDTLLLAQNGVTMLSVIQGSFAEVSAMTSVPLADAQTFKPLSDKLNAQGDSLLGHVDDKINVFGTAGVCPQVHNMISQIGDNVDQLMNAVANKFPEEGRAQNSAIIGHFNDIFASSVAKLEQCSARSSNVHGADVDGARPSMAAVSGMGANSVEPSMRPNTVAGGAAPEATNTVVAPVAPAAPTGGAPRPAAASGTGAAPATTGAPAVQKPVVTAGAATVLLSGFLSGVGAVAVAVLIQAL